MLFRSSGSANQPPHDDLGEPWATPLEEARLSTFLAADANNNADGGPEAFLAGRIEDAQSRYNLRNLVSDDWQLVAVEVATLQRLCEAVDVPVEAGRRDLSGVVRGAVAPTSIVQGTALTNASVSFDISNSGTTNFERNSSASLRAYLRPVGASDSSQDIAVSDSQRESLSSLGKGKSKSKSLKLKMPEIGRAHV